ncbi:hypothetical protein FPV67DRAFT_1552360 [Lyophyllum atratum]|nr:hypothetical protein FPV67DRAFT_1552360 [Lyophyllum atratum]
MYPIGMIRFLILCSWRLTSRLGSSLSRWPMRCICYMVLCKPDDILRNGGGLVEMLLQHVAGPLERRRTWDLRTCTYPCQCPVRIQSR